MSLPTWLLPDGYEGAFPGASAADWGTRPVGATDVDRAIIATVNLWQDDYLRQTELEDGLRSPGDLTPYYGRALPRNVRNSLTSLEFNDSDIPGIFVTTQPTIGNAKRKGDGTVEATFPVVVSCVVRGQRGQNTRDNASATEKAIRRLLLQQTTKMPDTPIVHMALTSFGVAPVQGSVGEQRELAAGTCRFEARVQSVVQGVGYGPSEPASGPYTDLPTVEGVGFDVVTQPPEED